MVMLMMLGMVMPMVSEGMAEEGAAAGGI
jgi:hypothetical protein